MPHDSNSLKSLTDQTRMMADAARSVPVMSRLNLADHRRILMRCDDLIALLAGELTGYGRQLAELVPAAQELADAARKHVSTASSQVSDAHCALSGAVRVIRMLAPGGDKVTEHQPLQLVLLAGRAAVTAEEIELFAPVGKVDLNRHRLITEQLTLLARTLRLTLTRQKRFLAEAAIPDLDGARYLRGGAVDEVKLTSDALERAIKYLSELSAVLTDAATRTEK